MNPVIALFLVCLPLKRLQVSSPFGYRYHPVTGIYSFHNGVDLEARTDTVYAVANGEAQNASFDARLGLFVKLDHGGFQSRYGHLSLILVSRGDAVRAGQPIGVTGATGRVTGEHLHFSIYCKQGYVNPLEFLYQLLIQQEHESKL